MTEHTEIHIDKLAYAVALLDGAKRIHSSTPGSTLIRTLRRGAQGLLLAYASLARCRHQACCDRL